ncbi:MAG: HEAT repeat domain-containing protein [Planctomycetota bacterium]|nr:HEAT repeat domain-containing protein [Planctomycetota bacterium]
MTDRSNPCSTPCYARVTTFCGLLLAVLLAGSARAEETDSLARALSLASRGDLPLAERLAAAARILAAREPTEAQATGRAAVALLAEAPETGGWLLLRATDAGLLSADIRARGLERLAGANLGAADAAGRARLAAIGLLLGQRPEDLGARLTGVWPAPDLVQAVLRRELGDLRTTTGARVLLADADGARALLDATRPAAAALDAAVSDEPGPMVAGLEALLAQGGAAWPVLEHEARLGALGTPEGRMPRAARAILVLGQMKDRRATGVLCDALGSPNGWVRVAAATALGDLGDPAGAVALAAHLTNTGDVFRARDQWDHPGATGTNVPAEAWASADYFVVDVAAADSLLRLGAPQAVGYLIHRQLDPTVKNARIRVFQDAVDALRRALAHDASASKLVADYNVDEGLPQRDAAFLALADWWQAHRDDPGLLAVSLDESEPAFRERARRLTDELLGTDVRMFMITKPALELLGRAATPSLIEALPRAERGSARVELARALALTRDPLAIPALRGLLDDKLPFVRAAAAEALGAFVGAHPDVRAELVALLSDAKPDARVSALKGLVGSPPSPEVLAAVRAATPKEPSADWARAETVLRLVQEGAAQLDTVLQGLDHPDRHVREAWWALLQAALDLPPHAHDPHPAPGGTAKRRLTRAEAEAALQRRRGA